MLTLDVVTPGKKIVVGAKVASVTVPGTMGEMTILPGHATLLSILEAGPLRFEGGQGQQKTVAALSSGFLEVKDDHVIVLAETLEMGQEIDIERAKRAQSKAEERLKEKDLTPDNFQKYQLKLQRALIRQQVAKDLKID